MPFQPERKRPMNTELENTLAATDMKAQYDACAKRLLGQKSILAHILVKTVDEFKGMNPKDVVAYIEGTPYISVVPVEPGLTNVVTEKKGERLVGFNTESAEINEGLVRFDIVFYVLIKRVYSIWVCMNTSENTMSHVHLTKDDLVGAYDWAGNLELFNIIMIGLSKEIPEHNEMYELHRLLGALLSKKLTINEKLNILGKEYEIPMEENFRKEVNVMCNLSQGIEEEGINKGIKEGTLLTLISLVKDNLLSIDIAAKRMNMTVSEFEAAIENAKA